jgi:predicted lipoprotein with Yx(FWY)xxD motif
MMKPAFAIPTLVAALLSVSTIAAENMPVHKSGGMLVDAKGMTVYTFDKDTAGKSACTGPCAQNWPPVAAGEGALPEPYTAVTRDDGSKQLAYKGKPLYTFAKDKKPGDKTGDKFKEMWHVVTD